MKKYLVCLTMCLLLFRVAGYTQIKGNYDCKISLSLWMDDNCNCPAKNNFKITFNTTVIGGELLANGPLPLTKKSHIFENSSSFGCTSSHTHSVLLENGSPIEFKESWGNRGWDRNLWWGCGSANTEYKNLSHLSVTPSGYTDTTFSGVVGNWSSSLRLVIQPTALKLTYENGGSTNDKGGPLPSKDKITLSCTPGYPAKVYNWQYFDGYEYENIFRDEFLTVPCSNNGHYNSVVNYYRSIAFFLRYYFYYKEYNYSTFQNYITSETSVKSILE